MDNGVVRLRPSEMDKMRQGMRFQLFRAHQHKISEANKKTSSQLLAELRELAPKIVGAVTELSKLLSDRGVEVVVGGSIAVSTACTPRITRDIDLNTRLKIDPPSKEEMEKLLRSIPGTSINSEDFYNDSLYPGVRSEAQVRIIQTAFKFDYQEMTIPVDVYAYLSDPSYEYALNNPRVIDGIKFAPLECICFWKMFALPQDDRFEKDRFDIKMMLRTKRVDVVWVRDHLSEHGKDLVEEWDKLVSLF